MMSIRHRAVDDSPIGPICRGETIPEELSYVSKFASRVQMRQGHAPLAQVDEWTGQVTVQFEIWAACSWNCLNFRNHEDWRQF